MRRRKRRDVGVFGMSFLDCISCGFGAAILLFILVDHARVDRDLSSDDSLSHRVNAMEDELLDSKQDILAMRAAISRNINARELADAEAERLRQLIEQLRSELPEAEDAKATSETRLKKLQQELLALESRVQKMRAASKDPSNNATRTVQGEGQRQYLTGLSVEGRHILILVDASASMLGETILDAIRFRNLRDSDKLRAPKWQRTLATTDWITAQMPPNGQFQMLAFNENTRSVMGPSTRWQDSDNGKGLNQAMARLRALTPEGGTSLIKAFNYARTLRPAPDNIYLITDGLPTQGEDRRGGVVSGRERARLFDQAVRVLPREVPVNIVLLPMEGDPRAASAFWQLARISGGSFIEPSSDWP